MEIRAYLDKKPFGEMKRIEKAIKRPSRYLARMIYGDRKFKLIDALRIEHATAGEVRREDILPDFDWSLLERAGGNKP